MPSKLALREFTKEQKGKCKSKENIERLFEEAGNIGTRG
jgi:hypothetical protein